MDKLTKLPMGEKVVGASGIVLLLFSFFTWFDKDLPLIGTYDGPNGWGSFLSLFGILIAVALVVVIVLRNLTEAKLPDKLGNFGWPQLYLFAGIASFAFVLLQVLVGQSVGGASLDRTIWAYLGLIAAAGVGAGGFLCFQAGKASGGESGTTTV